MILSLILVAVASASSPTKFETRFPHFANSESAPPVLARLEARARNERPFASFLRELHRAFDRRVRLAVEERVCREALTEDDLPELMVSLAMLRLRLRNLMVAASWLSEGETSFAELGQSFAALLALDGFDSINFALEDWGKRLERNRSTVTLGEVLGEARALWLAGETQSHGGEMTGRSTDRMQ